MRIKKFSILISKIDDNRSAVHVDCIEAFIDIVYIQGVDCVLPFLDYGYGTIFVFDSVWDGTIFDIAYSYRFQKKRNCLSDQ